jgi:TATA-box binding protein (TBP) (component of TFIID and TFIIIB)
MSALNILHSTDDPDGLGDKLPGRTVNVSCQIASGLAWLNMHYIAALGQIGLQYNPGCFVAGMLRMLVQPPPINGVKSPMQVVTALIYHTSKIMLTGASNPYVARSAAWEFMRLMNTRVGITPAIVYNFRIENIVCNFYLKFKVCLTAFAESEGKGLCSYNAKKFPAAIYRFGLKYAALVNSTGRIIITGSRDRANIAQKYDMLYKKLEQFRIPDTIEGSDDTTVALHKRQAASTHMDDRETSYMIMNKQVTMLFKSFDEYELEKIDEDAPEFGIKKLLHDYDAVRPIPITLAPGKRHSNLPAPRPPSSASLSKPPPKRRRKNPAESGIAVKDD